MLKRKHGLRRSGVELLADDAGNGGDGAYRELLVCNAQPRILSRSRIECLARPLAACLGIEIRHTPITPAAVKRAPRCGIVVVNAQVVILGDYGSVIKSFELSVGESTRITLTEGTALQITDGSCLLISD